MEQAQIRPTRPDDGGVLPLLAALDAYLYRQYPPEEFSADVNHILEVSALLDPSITFVAAWQDDEAVGCAAVRRMADAGGPYGEIKRMFVRPDARGRQLGARLLAALEEALRRDGFQRVKLETGSRQPEARRLYERCGYRVCGAFGDYGSSPVSVFMEKQL